METATQTRTVPDALAPIQSQWPTPLTASEWDKRFPGILDGFLLISGSANVIMQLARLPVGHGVAESKVENGSALHHPIKRARTTYTYLAVALMGTTEEKLAYRKAVNGQHAQVRSEEGASVKYNAFDPNLQLWVAACLYWGFAEGNRLSRGPLSDEKAAELYRLAESLGTTLQVRPEMWPADIQAFNAYFEQGLNQIKIDEKVRRYLTMLLGLSPKLLASGPAPVRFHGFVTTGFLPQKLRTEMQLEWSPIKQHKFDRMIHVFSIINRMLPRVVRQFPFILVLWDFRRRLRKGLPLV